jgi:hypothetical protein
MESMGPLMATDLRELGRNGGIRLREQFRSCCVSFSEIISDRF